MARPLPVRLFSIPYSVIIFNKKIPPVGRTGGIEFPRISFNLNLNYLKSERIDRGFEFDCASQDRPDCWSICAFVNSNCSMERSASRLLLETVLVVLISTPSVFSLLDNRGVLEPMVCNVDDDRYADNNPASSQHKYNSILL